MLARLSSAPTARSSQVPACPERVDAVMDTTGQATWPHSLRALKPGGKLVISGATTGDAPPAELSRVFFLQLSVVGSTMGTREELERLSRAMRGRRGASPDQRDPPPQGGQGGIRDHAARRRVRQDRVHKFLRPLPAGISA